MADGAHEASGPASSEPTGIARQQASGPASSDKGKLRVFISYSRDDLKFADQLDAALDACGFECLIDRHGISGGEDWKRRLGNLISEADTVVFVLSPNSARSEICAWEVEEAARLNKRILPVNCRPLEGVSPPPRLQDLNYMFFYEEPKVPVSGFGTGLASLIAALNTDFDWLREHTRYLQRAMEWDKGGRAENRLLSGNDILEAKAWVARRPKGAPEPTALQLDFIRASEEEAEARLGEQRKQLEAVAAAQAERETALHDREEALKQRTRVARVRNIALVAVTISLGLAALLGWNADQQRRTAETQRQQADAVLAQATLIVAQARNSMNFFTKREVVRLFEAGAVHGDITSMRNLGDLYVRGEGMEQPDFAKAREWYEKAVAKGDPDSMFRLGLLYENGQGVVQDNARAREWFEKAAAEGDQDYIFRIGLFLDAEDHAKALEWYEKNAAAALGNVSNVLGNWYLVGQGVAQDYTKAREWFEKAANHGYPRACLQLGLLYENGQGVSKDYARAREWFEKAASGESGTSTYLDLGTRYARGIDVAQDYAKAREWFEKAAGKGDPEAMFNLGDLYRDGHGVARDYAKAREWYEESAGKGGTHAMFKLGLLYEGGEGVAQDYAKARDWYEKSIANGDLDALINFGDLYRDGHGVARDYAKARELYEKAVAAVYKDADARLEGLPREAAGAGHYIEALQLQGALVAKAEAAETQRDGKPGKVTAEALGNEAWYALLAREFGTAFTVAERAHRLVPDNLVIEGNRAHALMFLERGKEAKMLYLAHKGKPLSKQDNRLWERVVVEDFAEFRKAGLKHPMMADIEKELGESGH